MLYEVITEIATELGQEIALADRLDAFGDQLQAELVAEGNGRGTDRRVVGIAFQILDEGTIEFQALDRQMLEIVV